MSQDNRLLPLTPGTNLDRPLRELTQPERPNNTYALAEPTHLRDYLSVVLKRKWLILSLLVVVTSLVAIQMYRMPTVYRSESTIQIEQKTKSLLKTKEFVLNAQTDPAYWGTQLKLLENPRLHRKVILALDLQNNPSFVGGQARPSLFATVRRIFSREKPAANAPANAPAGGLDVVDDAPAATTIETEKLTPQQASKLLAYEDMLRAGLTITPVERTNLVKIVYEHTNPELAMKIADTLAQVFIEDNRERETSGSVKSAEQLAKNIADLQEAIKQKQQEVINFRTSRGLPLGTIQGENLTAVILTDTTQQLMKAETERNRLQAAYEAAQRTPDIFSIPVVEESKAVQDLRGKLQAVEEQRQALLVQYTPEWPAVKKLDRQREQIQASLDKQAKDAVSALKARYEAAVRLENSLRQTSTAARGQAKTQSRSEMELGIIKQELETTQQLYNTAILGKREFDASGNDVPNNITISTPARRAEIVGPPRVRNILLGLLLSLAAGIGLAFLLDYLDDTLKSIEDVDRHIHLPTLALIPAPRAERRFMPARAALAASAGGETAPTALALIEEKRSPVAEAYRHLRTSLLLSSAGQPPKTVLVTSSQPSEGKTTTAVNTAVMLAQTGAEVLLLDCDLRRPRVHAHFGLPNTRGVTNYLSGDANVSSLVQEYEKLPNLKIITSGPVPPNSAELLGSEEMRRLLILLSDNFTHIIIDSPPAISFTDASILSTMVDGVMLVVHGGRSSRAVVRRAKQQLLDVGAHIYGIVLNNVKLESSDYYYYSGYYSSYYANEDEDQTVATEADEYAGTAKSK
jgi:polysaccharide biosynthesis transport protein